MKNIKELADEYIKSCKYTEKIASQIAQMIVEACKPIIRDMEYSIGWEGAGIDTICFYSETHSTNLLLISNPSGLDVLRKNIRFIEAIQETFPELSELWAHIDTPWGFWLTKEEAEKIKKILKDKIETLKDKIEKDKIDEELFQLADRILQIRINQPTCADFTAYNVEKALRILRIEIKSEIENWLIAHNLIDKEDKNERNKNR